VLRLEEHEQLPPHEVATALEQRSGLFALAGTGDMREVEAAADRGDPDARLAIGVYVHRLAGGIAAMSAATSGIDVLVFAGGVGEGSAMIRRRAAERLPYLGVAIDTHRNDHASDDHDITAAAATDIAEPVWPGRSAAELGETSRHEVLANLALGQVPATMLCPYDAAELKPLGLAQPERTHSVMASDGHEHASSRYSSGNATPGAGRALRTPPRPAEVLDYGTDLRPVRRFVAASGRRHKADSIRNHEPTRRARSWWVDGDGVRYHMAPSRSGEWGDRVRAASHGPPVDLSYTCGGPDAQAPARSLVLGAVCPTDWPANMCRCG
jgi:hypothetical protein